MRELTFREKITKEEDKQEHRKPGLKLNVISGNYITAAARKTSLDKLPGGGKF